MGQDTPIEWADDTWNPAIGCTKVSAGCRGCYMMRDQARYGRDGTVVRRAAPGTFDLPIKRDRQGAWKVAPGRLVFTASLTDIFHPDLDGYRDEVWSRMEQRPDLLFLVLTKRPERIAGRLPPWWGEFGPKNVALGVSAEDQAAWDVRVPILRQVRARLRFVSVEPMIGPITNPHGLSTLEELVERSAATGAYLGPEDRVYAAGIGWVIIGGVVMTAHLDLARACGGPALRHRRGLAGARARAVPLLPVSLRRRSLIGVVGPVGCVDLASTWLRPDAPSHGSMRTNRVRSGR